jgi:uncharacterized SAM-binding protein YcdF (DUF218 family)
MSRKGQILRRCRRWFIIAVFVATALTAALFVFATRLLCIRSSARPADAIVILGGEGDVRVPVAVALVTNGYAPVVVLTGHGDCEYNLRYLCRSGVRTNAVVLECDSTSTQQNALFTVRLLRERSYKRVIIVTSWYHSRRALSCFRKYAPEIEFLSAPAPRIILARDEWGHIAREYIKILWYALRYRISPGLE